MFLSLTPAPFLSFLSGPLINSLLPRHFSHLSVCLYFWSFICCFCSSLVCISPSLHVWYIRTFPFFSLSSPNSKPASCIFLCSHRDWTGVQSGGGNIWKDSGGNCNERQRPGIKLEGILWEPPRKRCCICSQTDTHRHTQTEWRFRDSVGVHTPPFPKITARWGAARQGEVGTGRYKWMLIVWLLQITLKSSRFIHKPTLCLCVCVHVCENDPALWLKCY